MSEHNLLDLASMIFKVIQESLNLKLQQKQELDKSFFIFAFIVLCTESALINRTALIRPVCMNKGWPN